MARMRALREDNDLTQAQVAQVLGTSQTMCARYEQGANELPIRHLVALCRFYNVPVDYKARPKAEGRNDPLIMKKGRSLWERPFV